MSGRIQDFSHHLQMQHVLKHNGIEPTVSGSFLLLNGENVHRQLTVVLLHLVEDLRWRRTTGGAHSPRSQELIRKQFPHIDGHYSLQ